MKVFRLDPDNDRFHNFALVDDQAAGVYHRFDGTPLRDVWLPLEIMAVDADDELAQLGDHALLGTIPVFSESAVASLRDLLESHGELLALAYPRRQYFAYNVTRVVDALDEGRSKLNRFSSGRVMSVEEFAFDATALEGHVIFRIPQLLRASVFATELFVERAKRAGLTGFDFREVWAGEVAG